jgi:hypothetical protein
MPTFNNISNGESGLSVRTTLNDVINYVNTGITLDDKYVTGGTYNNGTGTLTLERQNGSVNVTGFLTGVTETQNLQNVLALGNTTGANDIIVQSNILVDDGNRIQETTSGNTYIEISNNFIDINGSDGGVNSSYVSVSDTSLQSSSTDGTNIATTNLQNNGRITLSSSDGGDLSTIFDMYATSKFVVQSIDNNLGYTSTIELDAPGNDNGNRFYATDGNISSSLELDPVGNFNGTRISQEDSGGSTYLTFATDQSFWYGENLNVGSYGGGMVSANQVFFEIVDSGSTQTSLFQIGTEGNTFSSTDGTWTSTLELDPTEDGNTTNLSTTDGTNTQYIYVTQSSIAIGSNDGVNNTEISILPNSLSLTNIPAFDDDASASSLSTNMIYQTTGNGASPLDVAGILMIKQ